MEEPRNLDDTLKRIRNFPWQAERDYAIIGLTCPSVTIMNAKGEYLKVAIYFNRKFGIYFLNRKRQLHKMVVEQLDEVYNLVTSFFQDALPLKLFKKRMFSIGVARHFVTNNFEYKFKPVEMVPLILIGLMMISLAVWLTADEIHAPHSRNLYFFFLGMAFFLGIGIVILRAVYKLYKSSFHFRLFISRGKEKFYFGTVGKEVKYLKSDIKYIQAWRGKSVSVKYIKFNDGHTLEIPSGLIASETLLNKFVNREELVRYS